MGLMKKAVRRATPKPVRKAKAVVMHPARTAVRAATPRSLRQAKRTAFNWTHPINTAENALLDAATKKRSGRRTGSRAAAGQSADGRSQPTATPQPTESDELARRLRDIQAASRQRFALTRKPDGFRAAGDEDEYMYTVLVAVGPRPRDVEDVLMRPIDYELSPGGAQLRQPKLRRRQVRAVLRTLDRERAAGRPCFLSNSTSRDLAMHIVQEFAKAGATVELWRDA